MIETITPILRVENLVASRRYYLDVLGFKLDWEGPEMASVSRDGCALMLCEGQQGRTGAWVWVGVEDPNSSTSLTDPDEFVFSHGAKKNGAHKEWVIRMMGRN